MMRWVVGAVVVAGLLVVVVFGFFEAERRTSTDEAGLTVLTFGALPVPVKDDEPLPGRPPIFRGVSVNPAPLFDVSALGEDLNFVMREPDRSDLERLGHGDQDLFGLFGRVVYVGDDVHGSPVYLFQQTGPSIVDIVKGWFSDYETTGLFGSSYECCGGQSAEGSEPVRNQPRFGRVEVNGENYVAVEMWAAQDDVAVVAFVDENNQALGWQRPVSRYVGALFEADTQTRGSFPNIRMIAYDANGKVVNAASWPPFSEE